MRVHHPSLGAVCVLVVIAVTSVTITADQDKYDRLERAADLIRQEQLAAAEAELNIVLRKLPREANALNLLGVVRAQQHRTVEAEKLFLSATRQAPRLTGAYINLGRLYLDEKKPQRALWAFNEAVVQAPEDTEIRYQLAALYQDTGDFVKALSQLERIPSASWRSEEFYVATKSYLGLQQNSKALAIISSLRGTFNGDDAAAFASLFLERNLPDEAIAILEDARARRRESFRLFSVLGASYARKKEWSKAEESYTAALNLNNGDVATLRDLARVARAAGNLEKALSFMVQARKLAPEDPAVLYDFAVAAFGMNLTLDALPVAEKLYKQKPDEPAYVHLFAVCSFRHDEKELAEKLFRRFIQLRPQDTLGYYLLGVTLFTSRRYSDARESFKKSLTLGANPESEYMLGLIAESEGDKATALQWLERVAESSSSYAAAQALLGIVYAEQNNVSLARTTLERAIQLNPRDLRAHYQLGLIYAKQGEKERAQQMFVTADRLREEQRNEEVMSFKLIDPPE